MEKVSNMTQQIVRQNILFKRHILSKKN